MADPEDNSLIAAAEDKLGVGPWDRPSIFTTSAHAATESGLPYWMVLVLSGGIATLGLALNSSAVVIGAMLVAPLLAPVLGLALSLAVGDGKLAVQTAAIVVASTAAVILISTLLTALLPFHTITLEISARTRPTTLDLVIAIFSGLVGAVVTVARGSRLSAAIPGVAISVALIPPLAVAGFGMGSGWNAEVIYGSLLLYGANLAGIVLSGMSVFLLVGMHGDDVLETARLWHRDEEPEGLTGWVTRVRWVQGLGIIHSVWARVGLVVAFAVALGIPLSATLTEIARESRVDRAVNDTAGELFAIDDRASILSRQVVYGTDRTQVYLQVATTEWFDPERKVEFERTASARAGEPVRLSLEQLPTRGEDLDQLAALLPGATPRPVAAAPPPPAGMDDLVAAARLRLREAAAGLALPGGVDVVGMEIAIREDGRPRVGLAYAAPELLPTAAAEMLRAQLVQALDLPELSLDLALVPTDSRALTGVAEDSVVLDGVAEALRGYGRLAAEIVAPADAAEATADAVQALVRRGVDRQRIETRAGAGSEVFVRARVPARRAAPPES